MCTSRSWIAKEKQRVDIYCAADFFFFFLKGSGKYELTTQITQVLSAANSSIRDLIVTSFRQVYPCVASVL